MARSVLLMILLVLLLALPASCASVVSWIGWHENHAYGIIYDCADWDDAQNAAQTDVYPSMLVTIDSAYENDWLVNNILNPVWIPYGSYVWIGAYQNSAGTGCEPDNCYVWVDSQQDILNGYTNWASGQPDNLNESGQAGAHWAAMLNSNDADRGKWYDISYAGAQYAIAEYDPHSPTGSISINNGDAYAVYRNVTLSLSASDGPMGGISGIRFSDDGSSWSDWETYGTCKQWSVSTGDGTKTVYVQYKDDRGNTSQYSDTIVLDTIAPTGSVTINGGAAVTNSRSVTLTLSASDAISGIYRMRISNDGRFDTEPWESYATSKSWTLTTGDGTKTVYVRHGDNAGNVSTSFTDTIVLDAAGPPTAAIGAPSTNLTNIGPVTYTVTWSEAVTGFAAGDIALNKTGTANATVGLSGSGSSYTVTLSGVTGDGTIGISIPAGRCTDLAGNQNTAAGPSATFAVDNTIPVAAVGAPSASLTNTGPVSYTVNWSEPVTGFNSSGDIQVNSTGGATAGAVGVTGSGAGPYTVTLSSITGDGTLGITIKAGACVDAAGNSNTASSPSATFAVDNTAPTTTASPAGALYNSATTVTLTADETATIYYTTDGSEPTTGSSVYSAPIWISVTTTLRFFAVDPAGNTESPKKQEVYTIADPSVRISSIKSLADGASVTLGDKVLYLKQGYMGYIEEQDRSSGIRLQGEITASEDQLVSLMGTMGTTPGGERYILLGAITLGDSFAVRPLGVNNRDVMRSLMDGLYVTTWGRVKEGSVTGESFVLTDGSDDTGIMVNTPGDPGVSEGQYVTVSGAAGFDGSRVVYRR